MCWFLRRGENRSTRRKTSRSKDENQQQTQPTYDTGTGSRTRTTLVGGERSHHCAIPAPRRRAPHQRSLRERRLSIESCNFCIAGRTGAVARFCCLRYVSCSFEKLSGSPTFSNRSTPGRTFVRNLQLS